MNAIVAAQSKQLGCEARSTMQDVTVETVSVQLFTCLTDR
jgi:hypothetical protein